MCRAVILTAATGGWKIAQIYTMERPNREDSGRKHSNDVVPGKEQTAYNQKNENKHNI
jgi:hypothetical protein